MAQSILTRRIIGNIIIWGTNPRIVSDKIHSWMSTSSPFPRSPYTQLRVPGHHTPYLVTRYKPVQDTAISRHGNSTQKGKVKDQVAEAKDGTTWLTQAPCLPSTAELTLSGSSSPTVTRYHHSHLPIRMANSAVRTAGEPNTTLWALLHVAPV